VSVLSAKRTRPGWSVDLTVFDNKKKVVGAKGLGNLGRPSGGFVGRLYGGVHGAGRGPSGKWARRRFVDLGGEKEGNSPGRENGPGIWLMRENSRSETGPGWWGGGGRSVSRGDPESGGEKRGGGEF